MSEHFIKNIEIKNFKCFDNFKAEGFGRVNLIGGKNNVGKTAFMESLYINLHATVPKAFARAMYYIQCNRSSCDNCKNEQKIIELLQKCDKLNLKSNIREVKFSINDVNYIFTIDGKDKSIHRKDLLCDCQCTPVENINFINSSGISNNDITQYYGKLQDERKEKDLNEMLTEFDASIEEFQIKSTGELRCFIDKKWIDLAELGDATHHLISIITAIYASKKGYLFIDEIENGIHYTKLDQIWKIILTTSEDLGVQVFATTHSKECIESFNRVQKELKAKDTYYFEMYKNKKENKLDMRALDIEQLTYELKHGEGFRGE